MAQQENKINYSKKGKREVSAFIGHELLYDYLCGTLDQERSAAVADHIKYSREAQLDLTKIEAGEAYARKLSETVVSQPLIERLNTNSTYFSVLMQKAHFDLWPQGLKWGLEALVGISMMVVILSIVPWQKTFKIGFFGGGSEVILAEVEKPKTEIPPVSERPQFADEGLKASKGNFSGNPQAAEPGDTSQKISSNLNILTFEMPKKEMPLIDQVSEQKSTSTKEKPQSSDQESSAIGGYLYRGSVSVTNLAVIGPKITEKIAELGGRKAGGVDLGWQKTPTSIYYHFTIPEAKFPELSSFLNSYGKSKIEKEKHPRHMPDGIIRLIITVDEDKK